MFVSTVICGDLLNATKIEVVSTVIGGDLSNETLAWIFVSNVIGGDLLVNTTKIKFLSPL